MVVQVSTVHEVEDKAELVRGVEGVGHANNEGTIVARGHQTQHDPLVQGKGLALLHFDAFFVQTLKMHITNLYTQYSFIENKTQYCQATGTGIGDWERGQGWGFLHS